MKTGEEKRMKTECLKRHGVLFCVASVILPIFLAGAVAWTRDANALEEPLQQQVLVDKATIAVHRFATDTDMAWAHDYLKRAKGILIVPEFYKAGFVLGGAAGRGVLVVRDKQTGQWGQPAFYTIGSGSLGLQIGIKLSEVFMLVMTQKGIDALYGSSFKLGGEVSMAAGPVGASAEGATAPSLQVDYITAAYSMGAFAGISLEGAVVKTNYGWNKAYYGEPVRPLDILVGGKVSNPRSSELRAAVSKATE
jgi:lipid-binding SYLF domain-containing protein